MSDSRYGTPFVESEIALAISAGDVDEVYRLLRTMEPGELAAFYRQLDNVRAMASEVLREHVISGAAAAPATEKKE